MLKFRASKFPEGSMEQIFFFSLPMVISQACDGLMMLTDRYLISKFEVLGPPAALLGAMTLFTSWIFFMGLVGYVTPLVSRYRGMKEEVKSEKVLPQGVYVSLAASLLLMFFVPSLARWYFKVLQVSQEIRFLALRYIEVLVLGAGIVLLKNCWASYFAGIGKTRIITKISAAGLFLNVPLSYSLIRGDFSPSTSGIAGAAYGTLVSELFMLLLFLMAYFQERKFQISHWKFDFKIMKTLLRFGSGTGFEFLVLTLAFHTFLTSFQSLGLDAAQSVTIATSWSWLLTLPLCGLNIGLMSLVGNALGREDFSLARKTVRSGLCLSFVLTGVFALLFWALPSLLAGVFLSDTLSPSLLSIRMIQLLPFLLFCDATSFVLTAALRAGGDTKVCFLIALCVQWSTVILVLFGVYQWSWSPLFAWGLFIIGLTIQASLHILRYRGGKWCRIPLSD